MKRGIVWSIVGVLIVGGLIALAVLSPKSSTEPAVTFEAVQQDVANGALLYDVRTPSEYAAGHFESAVNWPLQDIQSGTYPDVAKDTTIYVYCQSGNRSGQAAALLAEAGFTDVVDLHGLADVQAIGGTLQ